VTPGPLAIGIDIGGTKVAAGVVDDAGEILALLRRDTPATSPVAVEDTIAELDRAGCGGVPA